VPAEYPRVPAEGPRLPPVEEAEPHDRVRGPRLPRDSRPSARPGDRRAAAHVPHAKHCPGSTPVKTFTQDQGSECHTASSLFKRRCIHPAVSTLCTLGGPQAAAQQRPAQPAACAPVRRRAGRPPARQGRTRSTCPRCRRSRRPAAAARLAPHARPLESVLGPEPASLRAGQGKGPNEEAGRRAPPRAAASPARQPPVPCPSSQHACHRQGAPRRRALQAGAEADAGGGGRHAGPRAQEAGRTLEAGLQHVLFGSQARERRARGVLGHALHARGGFFMRVCAY